MELSDNHLSQAESIKTESEALKDVKYILIDGGSGTKFKRVDNGLILVRGKRTLYLFFIKKYQEFEVGAYFSKSSFNKMYFSKKAKQPSFFSKYEKIIYFD